MIKTINSFFSKSPGVLQTMATQKMNPEQDGGEAKHLLCTDTTPFRCGGTGMVQRPGSGEGTLNIHADSSVTAGTTHIGFYLPSFGPGGTGNVTVDGAGAVLNTNAMTVGSVGQGTLAITNNGVVNSSGTGTVAANAGSTGTVDVSSSSNWNLVSTATGTAQNLTVGHLGNGTVNINTTGTVTAGNTVIGNGVTGVGTVNVDGADALMKTAGLTVGQSGTGTLNITDSGVVNSSGAGAVGAGANSIGEVNVSNGGLSCHWMRMKIT